MAGRGSSDRGKAPSNPTYNVETKSLLHVVLEVKNWAKLKSTKEEGFIADSMFVGGVFLHLSSIKAMVCGAIILAVPLFSYDDFNSSSNKLWRLAIY